MAATNTFFGQNIVSHLSPYDESGPSINWISYRGFSFHYYWYPYYLYLNLSGIRDL